jgi:hypothetical protein
VTIENRQSEAEPNVTVILLFLMVTFFTLYRSHPDFSGLVVVGYKYPLCHFERSELKIGEAKNLLRNEMLPFVSMTKCKKNKKSR